MHEPMQFIKNHLEMYIEPFYIQIDNVKQRIKKTTADRDSFKCFFIIEFNFCDSFYIMY